MLQHIATSTCSLTPRT